MSVSLRPIVIQRVPGHPERHSETLSEIKNKKQKSWSLRQVCREVEQIKEETVGRLDVGRWD